MLKTILIAIPIIVVVFFIIVAMPPSTYRVTRSIVIAATQEAVFPHMNELKKWEAWNPWGKADPNMKLTYGGPASGVGANYTWAGNKEVGEGRATITESRGGSGNMIEEGSELSLGDKPKPKQRKEPFRCVTLES